MVVAVHELPQRQVLHGVPWHTYEFLLDALAGRHLRISYFRGDLEIMTVSHEHEFNKSILGRLVEMMTFELNIPIHSGGQTTFRRVLKEVGLEADECYWIENERRMRGRKKFDIERDPPPDLTLEIEVTKSALPRMEIYAALRVPEVWRFDGKKLRVFLLNAKGKYEESSTSRAFPMVPIKEIERFLLESETTDETTLLRAFSKWVHETVLPKVEASKRKKNGKKSRK